MIYIKINKYKLLPNTYLSCHTFLLYDFYNISQAVVARVRLEFLVSSLGEFGLTWAGLDDHGYVRETR